jgi:hypothetical protein
LPADSRDGLREFSLGAPRVHGELLKLGITVSQATVSRYMPVSHGGQRSQTWRVFVRNHTAIVRNRTFDGHSWIDNIRSWSRVVRHRAATFAATAIAGPPSLRAWCFAHARSLIATHRGVRIARDEALSGASTVAVARRLAPSGCTVHPLAAGRIRGPPRWRTCSTSVKPSSQKPRHPLCTLCMGDAADRQRRLQRFAVTRTKLRNIGSPRGGNLLRIIFSRPHCCRREYAIGVLRNDRPSLPVAPQ